MFLPHADSVATIGDKTHRVLRSALLVLFCTGARVFCIGKQTYERKSVFVFIAKLAKSNRKSKRRRCI
jgi:hypothetical protein